MKKTIVTLVVLAGLGLLGWQIYQKAAVSRPGFARARSRPAVAVEVASVKRASIRETGSFSGSLLPLSEFIVAPKIAGRLEKLGVNIGDKVQGGQLLAALDDAEYREQANQASAELEVARANLQESQNLLQNVKREYERTAALRRKKIASASQLDAAESEFKTQQAKMRVAKAQVAQKQAALKMAEVRLAYARIRVPQNNTSGRRVVGERFVDEGAMLAPNTPIVSIIDIGRLIAVIHVIERDYSKIRVGLEATITTDAFANRSFSGRVVRIAPVLKEKSREARVEVEVPNDHELLKPGMFVRVAIQFAEHADATVVPTTALIKRNGIQGVYLADLEEQHARFVPVTLGIISGAEAEVLDPPLSGSVVTLGQHLLEDGAAIMVAAPQPAPGAAAGGTADTPPKAKPQS